MMTESNNLQYHPNDGSFDRLEEMEGGALMRYPVLRSVPVPMPRPWGTRGAIALLMVCGVIFGIIAVATISSSPAASEASTENAPANANIGGVPLISGSGSLAPDTVDSESSWLDGSNLDSSAENVLGSTSDETSDDASSDSAIDSSESRAEMWLDGSNLDSSAEDVLGSTSDETSDDASSDSAIDSSESRAEMWLDGSNLDSSAEDALGSTSDETSDDASSDSIIDSSEMTGEEDSASGADDSRHAHFST